MRSVNPPQKSLGYLSGAPRVSTRLEAAVSGPRSHVLGVMRAFARLGWEVRPFIVGDRVPRSWVTKEADVELGSSYLKRLAADGVRLGLAAVNAVRALWEVGRVDWVYERFGAFQFLGYGFQRRGIPWILETNGLLFVEAHRDRGTLALARLERALELWAYRQADAVVVVTETMRDLLVQHGVERGKIVVVPNGVDTHLFDSERVRDEALRPFALPTLGFVGTLYPWQGLDLLLRALAELRAEGVDLALVVVGDGAMRAPWEGLARELSLADRVRFVGRVPGDEVPKHVMGFDLAFSGQVPLQMGEMYHSPLKLYEYMAMGKPVVASAFEEARRLVREGETGYLFEPGSLEDLKRALRKALAEREAWPRMGERARAEVVAHHSWEARVKEMVRQIEGILEGKYGTAYPAGRGLTR